MNVSEQVNLIGHLRQLCDQHQVEFRWGVGRVPVHNLATRRLKTPRPRHLNTYFKALYHLGGIVTDDPTLSERRSFPRAVFWAFEAFRRTTGLMSPGRPVMR